MLYSFTSMCCPLHGIQVHAFLVHLPQGRKLAQLADLGAQELDGVVDLLLGGEAADREANRAVGELIRAPERPQNIRGLEARRSAGRARGHRHVLDPHDQGLALDEVEADVEVSRYAPLDVAVDVDLFHVPEAGEQPVAQAPDALALGRHLELRDAEGLAHADDLVGRERPRAQAPLVAAAVDLRLDAHAGFSPHVQSAYSLRSVDLVRGHRQEIHLQLLQVDRDLARGLHCVTVEDDALRAADLADLGDRLDHADLVVHHHHRRENGVGAQRRLELLQIEQPVLLRVEVGRFETLALELAHGVEHRLVLGLHRDDVLALALVEIRRALDGEVVAFGRTRGPDDLLGIGIEERRGVPARLFHRLLRLPAERVRAARRVAELLGEEGNHLLRHARVDRRGRGIVEVDREFHCARPAQADTAASLPRLSWSTLTAFLRVACWATRSESFTESRYSYILSLSFAHRSWVMQRCSSWQFSLPPHCGASSGSSTAVMMSATDTLSRLRASV